MIDAPQEAAALLRQPGACIGQLVLTTPSRPFPQEHPGPDQERAGDTGENGQGAQIHAQVEDGVGCQGNVEQEGSDDQSSTYRDQRNAPPVPFHGPTST